MSAKFPWKYGWLSQSFPESVGESLPTPSFRAFSDGTIVPSLGSNSKTFTRSGTVYYATDKNTVASVTANNPSVNAYPSYRGGPATTRQGILLYGVNRNECQYTNQFDQWTAIGSPTITADATTAPDGTSTADRLQLADTEGAYLSLVQDSTTYPTAWMTIGLWIEAVSGTPTIKLRVRDGGSNYWTNERFPNGFTISSSWEYYEGWGQTPTPGSGQLFYEVTASGAADVYVAFANLQFTGQNASWDHNSLGHVPAYMANAGVSRESTGATTLNYTSSEITGTTSEITVNQWVFLPAISTENPGDGFALWTTENSGNTITAGLRLLTSGLNIYLGSFANIFQWALAKGTTYNPSSKP